MKCFKAYDVRGTVGVDLDEAIARRIGRAIAAALSARRVVVGRDSRDSSPRLAAALIQGLAESGAEVLDLGLAGTEEVYFATGRTGADAGVEITASHNPADQNGMKFVGPGARPLTAAEFDRVRDLAGGEGAVAAQPGRIVAATDARAAYVAGVLDLVDIALLPDALILVNAGNGTAGPTFDAIADGLAARGAKLRFQRMHHAPDATFPHGVPNPLLPENQPMTAQAVRACGAALGVAWDGDFDRCFFFDETGRFIPGEFVVGMLAEVFLARHPGAAIVHDPRVVLNIRDTIVSHGGSAVMAPTGHAFLKAAMRASGAIYGGEMSAHHYFRDFYCCDSGMLPWLLLAELIGRSGKPMSALVGARMARFPASGEINFRIADPAAAIAAVVAAYQAQALKRDDTDGISLEFDSWRFNLRRSNTEALVRLNVEAAGDAGKVAAEVAAIRAILDRHAG